MWGGDAAGFNSRNTSHLSYCRKDVCLDAENALDPFFPPLADMKSLEQSKMLLISRLFWAPVTDCLLPRPWAHDAFSKNGFNKLEWGMNEHLAAAAALPAEQKAVPKGQAWPMWLSISLSQRPTCPTPSALQH